jgi:dienelactone hydrolase
MRPWLTRALLALAAGIQVAGGGEPLKPPAIWKDYGPGAGDFREEIVKQETTNGVFGRDSYISAYVLDQEIRVYCVYRVRAGAKAAPGLLDVHGWIGAPSPSREFVDDGWAVMAFDYCGGTGERKHYTKYPPGLRHGNMDAKHGGAVHAATADGKPIADPRQSSDYIWYAIQRRALSYLERQPEVDKTRLGARGYSYGGTLMWALGTDPRVKAVIAYFGIGWNVYYRDKAVWMYNNPYVEPEKTPGEAIFLAGIAPEAYVPYVTAATLYLNGSNDHHGGHERGLESFKRFQKGVPWSFAVQARAHHNTEKIGQDCKLWLDKHVLGKDVFWPAHPRSAVRLDGDGVPELVVTPASPERIAKVEFYYALKSPCSFARSWRDTTCVRNGDIWIGKMPVMNVDDYVFGYANITYDNTVVVSTDFNAAIPSKLGAAKATDKDSR